MAISEIVFLRVEVYENHRNNKRPKAFSVF
jgi:hypothetical protein